MNYFEQINNKAKIDDLYKFFNVDRRDPNALWLALREPQWIDLNLGACIMGIGAAAPDYIKLATTNILVPGFNGLNIVEELSGELELDHFWAEGTNIYPHVHWLPTTAALGTVVWQLEYTWTNKLDVEPASTTIISVNPTEGVAWKNYRADFNFITGTGKKVGSLLAFRFFRDPGHPQDAYTPDAAVKMFGLHVLKNTFGSRTIENK